MDDSVRRQLEERLVRYARFDTQSDDASETVPPRRGSWTCSAPSRGASGVGRPGRPDD